MSRYIDADALKEAFEEVYPLATNEMGGAVNKRIYDIIDNAPTVDDLTVAIAGRTNGKTQAVLDAVRPKGKWESRYCVSDAYYHVCSECKMHIRENEFDNYCPECGADMRGDV